MEEFYKKACKLLKVSVLDPTRALQFTPSNDVLINPNNNQKRKEK